MKLPPDPYVNLAKLSDYCLSTTHPEGKHKARVFRSALGLTPEDALWLRDALLAAAAREEAVADRTTAHGQRYTIKFTLECNGLTAQVCSGWLIRPDEHFPHLVSCYMV